MSWGLPIRPGKEGEGGCNVDNSMGRAWCNMDFLERGPRLESAFDHCSLRALTMDLRMQ